MATLHAVPTVRNSAARLAVTLALAAAVAVATLSAQQPAPAAAADVPPGLDAYVERTLRELEVPGASIAIVKDGHVVLARGYGVRELGRPERVDENTLFQIASNTKAMTAGAIAILVSEGKLRWDDRVVDLLPWFRLGGDPYVTYEMTVRDLLTHRSGLGLGAGDLLWLHSTLGREEIVRRLKAIAPTASFRSRYAYDNVLFIAAGELVGAAAGGERWDDFVRRRIFEPLGMAATQTSVTRFRPGDNVAAPHGRVGGRMRVVPLDTVDNLGGGGAVNSSAADMAKWVRLQLDSGRLDGARRLWRPAETRQMWAAHVPQNIGEPAPPLPAVARPNFAAYALGWSVRDYRGRKLVTHSGGLSGMLSRVMLAPDERLGVVVLTNGEAPAYEALTYWILDHYLGAPAPRPDWTAAQAAVAARVRSTDAAYEDSIARARNRAAGPSLPLARYAGRYADPWYGDVTLAEEQGHLVLRWSHSPALTADLEHWQYDTFRARMRVGSVPDAFVTFALDARGAVDRMTMVPVLPSTDFSFNYQDLELRPVR
ncbi:MAG TPA: serine hydrolase [Gemmatimonadaceae bacterium]|nr:serine hydrolase [Gemmatimonadaceae bacterium]